MAGLVLTTGTTTVLAVALPLLLLYTIYRRLAKPHQPPFPRFATSAQQDAPSQSQQPSIEAIMRRQYTADKSQPYLLEHTYKDILVVPSAYADELMRLPDSHLSLLADLDERFLGRYSKLLAPGGLADLTVTHAVKNSLTPHLAAALADVEPEVALAMDAELGPCHDWTPFYPLPPLMRIIARASGRVFAGPDLCRDDRYIDCALNFAVGAYTVVPALRPYPKWLRPLAQHWLRACRTPLASIAQMEQLLKPILDERRSVPESQRPQDMLTWLMAHSPPGKAADTKWQAMYQLQTATAAMHTTANTMTHALFDLAANALTLVPTLRSEIADLKAAGIPLASPAGAARLERMDSFLKESQRMHPFSPTGFSRAVLGPLTLADGTKLPPGVTATVPIACVARDPELYADPDTFDPLRFFDLKRAAQDDAARAAAGYVATGRDWLNWGRGVHACPGRFFAAAEMKMIIADLVGRFDIRLGEGKARPADLFTEGGMVPDTAARVYIRRRK